MRGHMSPAKTGWKSSIESCELLELMESHLFVCPMPCSHVHLYTMHVGMFCTLTFPRRLKCKVQKELGILRAGLMTKLQDLAPSWIAARPSLSLGWKCQEEGGPGLVCRTWATSVILASEMDLDSEQIGIYWNLVATLPDVWAQASRCCDVGC